MSQYIKHLAINFKCPSPKRSYQISGTYDGFRNNFQMAHSGFA